MYFATCFHFSIHGNQIGEAGVKILHPSLLKHPLIISLDIGDCGIGDEGLELICQLLAKRHGHPGKPCNCVEMQYNKIKFLLQLVMRQSACLVLNPITVNNYDSLLNCTPMGRASYSMMVPT